MERLSAGTGNEEHSFTQKVKERERRLAKAREARERENGRKTRGEKMAADSGQSDRREERGR